jgi:hypothetical protein
VQALHVEGLTVGLQKERASLIAGLDKADKMGGAVRAVIGDYGMGKTHLVEWTMQEALARHFLVATTSLDLLERPPHRSFNIYRSLIGELRYPDSQERGLGPLFKQAAQRPEIIERYRLLAPIQWDPLFVALHAFTTTSSQRQRKAWQAWLEGGRQAHFMSNIMPHHLKFPTIYKVGDNARQIAYLLGSLSLLARLTNYSGLCILLDEAESYSLLHRKERSKATTFFKAMIYSALGEQQEQIKGNSLPQLRSREYPATFGAGQALFFLFTTTHSENTLPLDEWLNQEQILTLKPYYNPKQIGNFLQQVQQYHKQAYQYQPDQRQGQIRRAAAEHLALGLRQRKLNLRHLVRLAVELFDLLYLYPDYQAVELLAELRRQMRE